MATTNDDDTPPLAEPGARRSGASTGGMRSTADAGLAHALQRSSERGDDDAVGRATTGEGMSGAGGPRADLGGKDQPGSAPGTSRAAHAAPSETPGSAGGGAAAGGAGTAGGTGTAGRSATAGAGTADRAGAAGGASATPGTTRTATGGTRPAGTATSGQPPAATRHDRPGADAPEDLPEAPRDEGPLESLGRAVSEVVTGPLDAPSAGKDEPRR